MNIQTHNNSHNILDRKLRNKFIQRLVGRRRISFPRSRFVESSRLLILRISLYRIFALQVCRDVSSRKISQSCEDRKKNIIQRIFHRLEKQDTLLKRPEAKTYQTTLKSYITCDRFVPNTNSIPVEPRADFCCYSSESCRGFGGRFHPTRMQISIHLDAKLSAPRTMMGRER